MSKVKGIVDIVFLMDATSDMMNCIQKVKENLASFFEALIEDVGTRHVAIKDWRAKVVGFRDFEQDGADDWFWDNLFTRDIKELEHQFDSLEAIGGGDAPESLLDAIYTVAAAPKSAPETEDLGMWRDCKKTAREVIVFTDAPFKPVMAAPGCKGGTIFDVRNICVQEGILLTVFAPRDFLDNESCFEYIDAIPFAKWFPVSSDLSNGDSALDCFVNNKDALREILRTVAKGFRMYLTRHVANEF